MVGFGCCLVVLVVGSVEGRLVVGSGMFRFLGVVVGCVLVGVACSSGGSSAGSSSLVDEAAGVSVTSGVEASTTTVDERGVLAEVLGVEAPSTTISGDADEQAAADIVYFDYLVNDKCLAQLAICDTTIFGDTRSERFFESTRADYAAGVAQGVSFEAGEFPVEQTHLMVRRSETNEDVIGVLSCRRNYRIHYNPDGSVLDGSSPAALALSRVVREGDGVWLLDDWIVVAEFQPETDGGNACLEFEGSEFPEVEAADFLA